MDTKKLRQKILDLAIRGKLVPQDPNDEPASVLLERIKAEKERLIQEGKIKRPKKSTADTSHYQNWPYEIPKGWKLATIEDVTPFLQYGTSEKSERKGLMAVLRMGNITRKGNIDFSDLVFTSNKTDIEKLRLKPGDLLFNRTNSSEWVGKTAIYRGEIPAIFAGYIIRMTPLLLDTEYVNLVMNSQYERDWCNYVKTDGVNQSNINSQKLAQFILPIPPLAEQKRIVNATKHWLSLVESIEQNKLDIQEHLHLAKQKVLQKAIEGELAPQNPDEESAIELLKRINPNIKIPCDNPHYQKLPDGWSMCRLEDIVDYEQPQAYIVESTDYSDDYDIPVLTAGKTFVIGYTNEETGICDNLPVIIFDDFTTDSKYVEFPFKVKSSAMKILRVRRGINIKYVAAFMAITKLIGKTHKRYWISEYSKIEIPIPPQKEQERIIMAIEQITAHLNSITTML